MTQKSNKKNLDLQKSQFEVLDKTFYEEIADVILQSRKRIYRNIDSELVFANWTIVMFYQIFIYAYFTKRMTYSF